MRFYIGQTVELVNNDSMAAEKGATAIVRGVGVGGICVDWLTESRHQINGYYFTKGSRFKHLVTKGKQLEFSFMGEDLANE